MEMSKDFAENGFIKVSSFLSAAEVKSLRNKILKMVDQENGDYSGRNYIGLSELPESTQILSKIFSKKLGETVNGVFEKPYVMPDFITQVSNTPSKLIAPHYDIQSYFRHNLSKQITKLKYAKIGIYLQANSFSQAGGIWYVPKSHKMFIHKSWFHKLPRPIKSLIIKYARIFATYRQVPLCAEAGDLLLFDGRLFHSSAPETDQTKVRQKKIAIYFSLTGDLLNARSYAKTEMYKFGDEILSDDKDNSQRINYVTSSGLTEISDLCTKFDVKFFALTSEYLMKIKN